MFKRILVANRGEIAVRIIRACKEMGIESVAVYSDADKESLHAQYADMAFHLPGNRSQETYMNIEAIIAAAHDSGATAIHPGYGFLSEREKFAKAVVEAGLTFIGPDAEVIKLMGDKIAARQLVKSTGVPIVRGSNAAISTFEEAREVAEDTGYPVLVKASAGGGGMGMKVARNAFELEKALVDVQKFAGSAFGDNAVFVERYIERPRHIEVQIMADKHGNIVHLGERECSIQRRHQKVVEESPSAIITPQMREEMGSAAVAIAKAVNYNSVGTIEFIYENGEYYFLEMNTRIQVEHTITEMVTGIDIVKKQIQIAAGEKLGMSQGDVVFHGHAIECRVCAEDPLKQFTPSPAVIEEYVVPGGFGIRLDSGVCPGYEISVYYDSLISKIVAWGSDRDEAIARMRRALSEYYVTGPVTTIPFLWSIMCNDSFKIGDISTKFIEEHPILIEETRDFIERRERPYSNIW